MFNESSPSNDVDIENVALEIYETLEEEEEEDDDDDEDEDDE